MTLAELQTRVKTHIRAELSTPAVNDLNDNSIAEFANEHTGDVISLLDTSHYSELIEVDYSLTFASGYEDLPSNYQKAIAVKVTTTDPAVTKKDCRLFFDPAKFSRLDSSNFVITPTQRQPVALVAEDKVFVKPDTLTTGFLDYVKEHPTITSTQGTLFSPQGDNILVRFVLYDYYIFLEEPDLAAAQLKLIGSK